MKKRQLDIVWKMLQESEYIPVKDFALQMQISEKSIRRDMEDLQCFLKEYDARIIKKVGTGIRLDISPSEKIKLLEHLRQLYSAEHLNQLTFAGTVERKQDLLLSILFRTPQIFSVSGLAEEYFISKSSIHSDMVSLEACLKNYQLSIVKNMQGSYIQGNEIQIRRALLNEVYAFTRIYSQEDIFNGKIVVSKYVKSKMEALFDDCYVSPLIEILESNHGNIAPKLTYLEQSWLMLGILIQLYRIKTCGMIYKENDERVAMFERTKIFDAIVCYEEDIIGEELTIEEMSFLDWLLSGVGLNIRHMFNLEEVADSFSDDFIDAFSAITGLSLRSKAAFCLNVRQHIFFMLSRVASGQKFKNPILEKMRAEYRAMEMVCRIITQILCHKYQLSAINDDEISYLMVYIQSEIIDYETTIETAVVFDEKRSLRNLFQVQLNKRFHNLQITFVDSYTEKLHERYDLVLSTIPIYDEEGVYVSAVLGESEYDLIDKTITKIISDKKDYFLELVRILNDLHDIGIEIITTPIENLQETNLIWEMHGNCQNYRCMHHKKGINRLSLLEGKQGMEISFVLNSWDYMLFSSKLVYLLENSPSEVVEQLKNYLEVEWEHD